jgi:hypothetical protein
MIKVVFNLSNDSILDFILMYFDTWLYIDVFWHLTSYWCISVNSCVTDVYIFAFLLYTIYFLLCTVYFCYILEKNTNIKHISGAPFLISVEHPIRGAPKWGAPQILCVAHALGCATDTTHSRGAYRHAPQIKYTCGLICVAHHRCTTKPQNVAPQIGFLLVVYGKQDEMVPGQHRLPSSTAPSGTHTPESPVVLSRA